MHWVIYDAEDRLAAFVLASEEEVARYYTDFLGGDDWKPRYPRVICFEIDGYARDESKKWQARYEEIEEEREREYDDDYDWREDDLHPHSLLNWYHGRVI